MGGTDTDARGQQAAVRGNIGSTVAAQVETVQPAAGSNSIGAASARHAGTNDQFCLRQPLQDGFCQHGLLFRVVKSFADDITAGKNFRDILRREL